MIAAAAKDKMMATTVRPTLPSWSFGSRYSVTPSNEKIIITIRKAVPKVTIATTGLKYLRPLNRAKSPKMISMEPSSHALSEAYLITGVALKTGQANLDSKVKIGWHLSESSTSTKSY